MQNFSTLSAIQSAIAANHLSVPNLVEQYLHNIRENEHLNAFIEVFSEDAQRDALKVQSKFADGSAGKLAGLVIGIKDNICYKEHKVSAGSKILENFESIYNATVIEKLLAEDAIIIGRLNCDEFAMGASNETSYYGPVLNAADNSRVSGGSSGGSAVAVQANLCHAALGTDTGGSIRQPASFCGVVGLKPSYARVSRHGVIAYASSFDQVGPITKSIEDAALILSVIAGEDDMDATVSKLEVADYLQALKIKPAPTNIAYLRETLESEGLDKEVKEQFIETITKLKEQGHTVNAVDFPYLDYIVPAYYILTTAEASANLARYDGVRFGYRSPNAKTLDEVYLLSRTEGFGAEVKRRIMLGTFVLSAGYYDAYYAKAQKVRRIIRDQLNSILNTHPYIILPTAPSTAFAIGEKIDDPIKMFLADIFTVKASLAGLPAISVPVGVDTKGLPIGMQVITRAFEEANLLSFCNDAFI